MARIFIISNRVAVPQAGTQPGGLEVVLKATLKKRDCVWLGWSGEVSETPHDPHHHRRRQSLISSPTSRTISTSITTVSPTACCGRSSTIAWTWPNSPAATCQGYLRVNDHFADDLAKVLQPDDIVWVHDYHLIPLAKALRAAAIDNRIGFFLHIPLPPPEILTAMPNHDTPDPGALRL